MEGEELFCLEGSYLTQCRGCYPPDVTEEEYYYYMTEGGCGYAKALGEFFSRVSCSLETTRHSILLGGYADELLDFLLEDVFSEVDDVIADETDGFSRLSTDRDRTTVMGYSMGGLFSCYAAWVRPEV